MYPKNYQKDEHDILFEVTEEVLYEVLEPVHDFLNSNTFKDLIKERMKERGVEINFLREMDETSFILNTDEITDVIQKYTESREMTESTI